MRSATTRRDKSEPEQTREKGQGVSFGWPKIRSVKKAPAVAAVEEPDAVRTRRFPGTTREDLPRTGT